MAFFLRDPDAFISTWTVHDASADNQNVFLIGKDLWIEGFEVDSDFFEISALHPNSSPLVRRGKLYETLGNVISVPKEWPLSHPATFRSQFISRLHVNPTVLSAIVILALTPSAYNTSATIAASLNKILFSKDRFLEEGEIIVVHDLQDIPFEYRLQVLEPVRRGQALSGVTEITLLSCSSFQHPPNHVLEDWQDPEGFEIDENFLANAVFNPSTNLQEPRHGKESKGASFIPRPLIQATNEAGDFWTLRVRTRDLGRMGLLSGDWAIASTHPSSARLVKVVGEDDQVTDDSPVIGPPILLFNLSLTVRTGQEGDQRLMIHPFDSAQPAIPTAKCVTIARVSCALSNNKKYQDVIVNGLKQYFKSGRKLVKVGDLLAVSVDTSGCRWSDVELQTESEQRLGFTSGFDEEVFFKITNLEYDIKPGQSTPLEHDFQSASGELGCWIGPDITKVVQSGVEYSVIPNHHPPLVIPFDEAQEGDSVNPLSQLLHFVAAALSQRAASLRVNTTFLLTGNRGGGKFAAIETVAQTLGLHLFETDFYELVSENSVKTEATLRIRFDQARTMIPCIFVLRHLEALSQTTAGAEKNANVVAALVEELNSATPLWKETGHPLVVVATTTDIDKVPQSVLSCFKQSFTFGAPDEKERLDTLKVILDGQHLSADVVLTDIAKQTASLHAQDLRDLGYRARTANIRNLNLNSPASTTHNVITAADFTHALARARSAYSESIGAPKIPTVTWDDVGGLAHVKADILDTIQLPLEHPDLFTDGLKKRSGVLLYGPPGTGKTLVAKAVATSCSLNFFSIKGPELLNMYIGESEANVRRVFQRARDAKPCVIFFDELDSVAPKRGNHGDSGGVMDRIVSQLLAELDGMSASGSGADVFVIGATNRPDLLDPALLRPGRFDRMLYLGVSQTHEAQLDILEALTRKFQLEPGSDLRTIANQCPLNYTGADFYALCSDAMLNAMSRTAENIEAKIRALNDDPERPSHFPSPVTPQYYLAELASPSDIQVLVSSTDFERALHNLVPSVSQAEMEHYAHIQARFSQDTSKEHA